MKTKFVMTFAFLFGICAIVKSQPASSGLYETSTDRNDLTYRFVGNTRYLILNPSEETLLYQYESHYYFSRGALGQVQELTLKNVKNAFPNDLAFHEALDAEFRSDAELASYELLPVLAAILPVSQENQISALKISDENGGH